MSAKYRTFPELEPYGQGDRYDQPKEDFQTIAGKLREVVDPNACYKVGDIGCGNGEFIYYLRNEFPGWEFHGYDSTPEYVRTAHEFAGLKGVDIRTGDLFALEDTFDIVLATSLLPAFPDVERPLSRLIDLCRDGGLILATGLFNPCEIEVRVEFCDNSDSRSAGQWRTDFNRPSQASIRRTFGERVREISFYPCPFNVRIPRRPDAPIRVWTVETADGEYLLVNGAGQILNYTLLMMRK